MRILQEQHGIDKPDDERIPATIPGTNWVHAGAVARNILAELEEMMRAEAQRCRQVRQLAEQHIGDQYGPQLSRLIDKLFIAEETLQ